MQAIEDAGHLAGLAQRLAHGLVQHVLDERGLARARHPGDAHQPPQRKLHVDVAQIVFAHAGQADDAPRRHHDRARLLVHLGWRRARRHLFRARQVLAGERARIGANRRGRVEGHDLAAALARAGAQVEQPVRGQHDLRIVFHDHQRVARIAQAMHHLRHALHVARMQADRGLIQHEQRVHQRGAERRRQVDALDFAARQRARLTIEREIAEAHFAQIGEARAYFGEQQVRGLIQRRGQRQAVEERAGAIQRQQHQVVDAQSGHAPQQRVGLEPRAAAGVAGRVGAIARQQHAHVHLVGLALQPLEEALDAVPDFLAHLPSPSMTHCGWSSLRSRQGVSSGMPALAARTSPGRPGIPCTMASARA